MIRVMSFNIRYGKAEDGINRWENRRSLVLSRIRAFEPDLIGMQECRDDDEQAAYVKKHLSDYEFIGWRRGIEGDSSLEMAPILYKKDTFDCLAKGVFWLSETPNIVGSKNPQATFPRTVTWVELLQFDTQRSLIFVNTHFDYQPASLGESAALLSKWVQEQSTNTAIILTGDFNAVKDSEPYKVLTSGSRLSDAHRQAASGKDENSFHGYGTDHTSIDWILVSDHFHALQAEIDRTQNGDIYPSDHYPITAIVSF